MGRCCARAQPRVLQATGRRLCEPGSSVVAKRRRPGHHDKRLTVKIGRQAVERCCKQQERSPTCCSKMHLEVFFRRGRHPIPKRHPSSPNSRVGSVEQISFHTFETIHMRIKMPMEARPAPRVASRRSQFLSRSAPGHVVLRMGRQRLAAYDSRCGADETAVLPPLEPFSLLRPRHQVVFCVRDLGKKR